MGVKIIGSTQNGVAINAAAARISTMEGTAMEILEMDKGEAKNFSLVDKVMRSGHRSIIEHHAFNLAFENVSALVEQFLIEFRLASFMVKSRRYVDFGGTGYHVPDALEAAARDKYIESMSQRFAEYAQLTALGIPREDARFVLPYCFYSNLYMSLNARELMHVACTMLYGRGSEYDEIRSLGESLKEQFDRIYPGFIEREAPRYATRKPEARTTVQEPTEAFPRVELLSAPSNAHAVLEASLALAGRYNITELDALLGDARPRELECLNYTFRFSDVSLSCVTHFARHRIHSPIFPEISKALADGRYVLPESIRHNPEALSIYQAAFQRNAHTARALLNEGMHARYAPYFALSGLCVPFLTTINARELLHFTKLRSCRRAQWEIQSLSRKMLKLLRQQDEELFARFGPSCLMSGACPEGRMSCGNPFVSPEELYDE